MLLKIEFPSYKILTDNLAKERWKETEVTDYN